MVSPSRVVLHMLESSERYGNPDLKRGFCDTLFKRRIVICSSKVPHRLEIKRIMS